MEQQKIWTKTTRKQTKHRVFGFRFERLTELDFQNPLHHGSVKHREFIIIERSFLTREPDERLEDKDVDVAVRQPT